MNETYIVFIFWIASIFIMSKIHISYAFFLKQHKFGNIHRLRLTINEIENNILKYNMTIPLPQLYEITSSTYLTGNDMHFIENISEEEVILKKIKMDHKKMELIQILESSISENTKIDITNNYPEFFSESKNDWIYKKWLEDEYFDNEK